MIKFDKELLVMIWRSSPGKIGPKTGRTGHAAGCIRLLEDTNINSRYQSVYISWWPAENNFNKHFIKSHIPNIEKTTARPNKAPLNDKMNETSDRARERYRVGTNWVQFCDTAEAEYINIFNKIDVKINSLRRNGSEYHEAFENVTKLVMSEHEICQNNKFHVYADFLLAPADSLHWLEILTTYNDYRTGRTQNNVLQLSRQVPDEYTFNDREHQKPKTFGHTIEKYKNTPESVVQITELVTDPDVKFNIPCIQSKVCYVHTKKQAVLNKPIDEIDKIIIDAFQFINGTEITWGLDLLSINDWWNGYLKDQRHGYKFISKESNCSGVMMSALIAGGLDAYVPIKKSLLYCTPSDIERTAKDLVDTLNSFNKRTHVGAE